MYFFFNIYLIWPRPSTRIPATGVMKFTTLIEPSLVIINMHFICLRHALQNREEFLKRNNVFVLYNFYGLALAQESLPRGQEIYDFYRPFIGYHCNKLRLLNHAAELKENIFF